MKRRRATILATLAILLGVGSATAATVDGADIHWTSTGSGTRTVVFVHGWTCDETSWDAQVPVISQQHRVITLDLPGHGQSGSPGKGTFSIELFARAVEAVRVEAGVDRAILVGHSMGTPVIRQYALMYPKRVTALVLADGLVLVPGSPPFTPASLTGEAGLKRREGLVRSMFDDTTPVPVQEHILKMMLGTSEATASGAMIATFDRSQWTGDPITLPVLAIYAEGSGTANREGLERLYPAVDLHEIPGTNHFLMMEKPDEFNRLLSRFLATL
jgi:pimeloyl-ACP methyl ester carboxylesterase